VLGGGIGTASERCAARRSQQPFQESSRRRLGRTRWKCLEN
jgi:hypothetical protein